MNRRIAAITGVLGLALGLAVGAFWSTHRLGGGPSTAALLQSRVFAMNVAISSIPFWNEPRRTWQQIGSVTPGLKTLFGGPASSDPAKQIEEVDAILARKIDGLVVFSTDPNALAPTIDKATDSGIPVVTIFADVPKSKRVAYVGANQVESAKAIARRVVSDFPDRIRPAAKALVVVGKIGAEDQDERRRGFELELGSKVQLVNPVVDDYAADKAAEVIRAALTRDPDIAFIFGCNSQSAVGAITALKELGKKPGEVVVTAWDSEDVVIREIKARAPATGWVHATSVLHSGYMVQTAFALLEAAHFGYLYASGKAGGKGPLLAPRAIEIPMRIVTADNVDDFLAGQAGEAP